MRRQSIPGITPHHWALCIVEEANMMYEAPTTWTYAASTTMINEGHYKVGSLLPVVESIPACCFYYPEYATMLPPSG